MKKFLLLALLSISLFSCSTDSDETNAENSTYSGSEKSLNLTETTNITNSYVVEDNCCIDDVKSEFGWKTAAVDAAGALGGAGSVASVAGWLGFTPAAPVAGVLLCVGAVVGGVGASAAVHEQVYLNPEIVNPIDCNCEVAINYADEVGLLHNTILYDYFSIYDKYTSETYYNFVIENAGDYNLEREDVAQISLQYLKNQERFVKRELTDITKVNQYALNNLPENVDRSKYSTFLNNLSKMTNKSRAINYIKSFETQELQNDLYDDSTLFILGSYFSTYRYSIEFWY